jgi:hypothetical protein
MEPGTIQRLKPNEKIIIVRKKEASGIPVYCAHTKIEEIKK